MYKDKNINESNSPQVTVLMSTYNGEKYIEEQLNSIFSQTGVLVSLFVRDDGSTDSTQSILDKWSRKFNMNWFQGDNIGSAKSFMELVRISTRSDFYAFSDQDDVWDRDRLISGIYQLKKVNSKHPVLYYSNYRVVNKNLDIIKETATINKDTYATALLQSRAIGCSMIFNYKAKQIIENNTIKMETMHDAWMYRMCYSLGEVIFDENPHFSYRQHESNVIGVNKFPFEKWIRRIKKLRKFINGHKIVEIKNLYKCYGEAMEDPIKEEIIYKLSNCDSSVKNRLKIFLDKDIKMVNILDTYIFKILLLLGIFRQ